MANQEHLDLLRQGVQVWNQRKRERMILPNLIDVNLTGVDLNGVDFFTAQLIHANLSGADLRNANLRGANLHDANLRGADLRGASFYGAQLQGANFSQCSLFGTVFVDNDLRTVKGLLEINHKGPSIVQLYTIKLPQDGSAIYFLRGAGVPEEWIGDYRAHMMHPIQYHSCFISYSSKDNVLARRLCKSVGRA